MESLVIFQDGMDNDPADFNNLQTFGQRSNDHIVADGITADRKFAGFQANADSAVNLTVQPGRYYSGGKVYNAADPFTYDFTTKLPAATKRIAVVVAWGEEVDTDTRPREFLINEETNASEPRVVAMEHARVAKMSVAFGDENADPIAPILDSSVTSVATIVLTPTGIASVTATAANALDSVASVAQRTGTLEDFQSKIGPQVQSLGSDIAALTKGQASLVPLDAYGRTLDRLAVLEAKDGIPSNAFDSYCDLLLDEAGSDSTFAGYSARISEGLRFPTDAPATSQLAILNPLNPAAKIVGGVLFPAYTRTKRVSLTGNPKVADVALATYTFTAHNLVQKTASRHRVRHGPTRTVSSSANWLKTGRFDTSAKVFRLASENWTTPAALKVEAVKNHVPARHANNWEDSYEVPYWEEVTVANTVNGTNVAQTFLNSNDMWLDAVGLTFTRLAAAGNVTVLIVETDRGMPLMDKVVSQTAVDRATLTLNAETVIPIQPAFLTGGLRYAIVVLTAADHALAAVAGDAHPGGTFFYYQDNAFVQGDGTKAVMFSLYQASFGSSRAVIDLNPLSLAGGISDIDVLASAVIPGSTQLTYEIQVGGVWYPLAAVDSSILGAGGVMPNLVAFRAVFTGTPDVMPALSLTTSQVTIQRVKTAFTYISAPRHLPAPSSNIHVTVRLEYFDPAHHSLTATLLCGATYATVEAADSQSDVTNPDGSIDRTFVFNTAAAQTDFRVNLVGNTDNSLDVFHIAQRKDFAI